MNKPLRPNDSQFPTRVLLIDITGDWLDQRVAPGGRFAHVTRKAVRPLVSYPIGLMYLAASARRVFGDAVACRIVSTALDCPTVDALVTLALRERPDIVGIRALSMHRRTYAEIVAAVRAALDPILILGGGPYPSSSPDDALCQGAVDAVVLGEGEQAFVSIIDGYLRGQRAWHGVPGVHAAGGDMAADCSRPLLPALDELPFPDYSKSLVGRYERVKNMSRRYTRHANVLSSRGCPYRCTYCHNLFGKRFRYRSADNVLQEIRSLYETLGIREFQFIDDCFNLRRDRLLEFFGKVVQSGMPLTFSFPNGVRADLLDQECIDAMMTGGTRYLFFAIESASARIQALIHKKLRLERVADNIAYATRRECVIGGFFMLGFPTETLDEARATVQFACDTDLTDGYFFVVTHYPGTAIYDLALKHGYTPGGEDGSNFFKAKRGAYAFTSAELAELARTARRSFYFSEKRIALKQRNFPAFFSPKEITEIMVSQIASCGLEPGDLPDAKQRQALAPYFSFARRLGALGIQFDF